MPPRPNDLERPDFNNYTVQKAAPTTTPLKSHVLAPNSSGLVFEDLLKSRPWFEGDAGDDAQWTAGFALGKGSFGHVVLYRKRDMEGKVIDEIAVKQQKRDNTKPYPKRNEVPARDGLLREAVILDELVHEQDSDTIVHLRGYKWFPGGTTYRFYLLFCPHGDIHRLVNLGETKTY